jgi:hypothetical protein
MLAVMISAYPERLIYRIITGRKKTYSGAICITKRLDKYIFISIPGILHSLLVGR